MDSDFRKEIKILLYNHGNEEFRFEKHTRVAQLLIVPILTPDIEEIYEFAAEKKNERIGGFGSTGLTG